ncbi:cysteine hydrolase [Cellulomonas hominis]|uniref:Isochorismatase n=1 Tax=Cellulomonas hominis TaxID=156981 RepID=A0A511FJL0_9CELL|nr:isochorismatase family cysteine hydrolase [Cellulomonas hominis]MBB5473324.1 nicotinamidase-related amidase [Cellulomonas hominis]MBU5421254.1 cysteine hydrolase [Cellulomonas hominis]GEL48028.1 isochorismatase [Cellulomonas hominis]
MTHPAPASPAPASPPAASPSTHPEVPVPADRPVTALVLVDVIASFFDPAQPNHYPGVERVLGPMAALLSRARERGTLVVHAVERHHPGLADFEFGKLPLHHQAGAPDAAYVPGFEPLPGGYEVEVTKRRFSAFYATDLDLLLREQGVRRVVVAGVKTNVCIRATAQDAFAGGFEPVVPREATSSNRPHLAEASLEDIDRYMGRVVDLATALELL